MPPRLLLALAAASIAVPPAGANTRPYLELNGGLSFAQESKVHVPQLGDGRIHYGTSRRLRGLGLTGGGAVGLHWNTSDKNAFRVEMNGAFRRNNIQRLKFEGVDFRGTGHTDVTSGMMNLYYEHDFGELAWVRAYIGGGAGVGMIEVDYRSANTSGVQITASDDSAELGWNAMAGVALPIVDHVDLTAGYRYFGMLEPRLDARVVDFTTGEVSALEADVRYHVHELLLGVRFTF